MNTPLAMRQTVTVELSLAEALVMSDCLGRLNTSEQLAPLVDKAEQNAFWALDNLLEKLNPVIFSNDYDSYVRQAKAFLIRSENDV